MRTTIYHSWKKFFQLIFNFPAHSFITGIIIVLFVYHNFTKNLPINEVFLPITCNLTILLVSFGLYFYFRNIYKSGIFSTMFILLFYSYSSVFKFFNGSIDPKEAFIRHPFLILFYLLLMVLLVILLKRIKTNFYKTHLVLNMLSLGLLIFSCMTILNIKKDANRISFPHLEKAIKANCVSNQKSPDIFYLIFDTYGGIHSLKKYMKYDNQPFYDYLNQHGFITPAYSNCYYPDTRLSLVSLLNLNFLDPKIPLENAFKENMVMETLHRFGYINHFFSTGSYFFVDFDGLDYFHEISFLNPFRFKLFEMTPLLAIESRVLVYDYQSKTTLTLKKISEMKPEKKSKFIFAHILCPHPPFVFGQNGEIADKTKFRIKLGKKLFLKQIYTDQITYLNELIKGTVDNLKSNYNNNVVIILQADNGFFFNSFYELTSNSSLSKEDYKMACTEIFNAIYLPDGNLENLKDTISSINTMRLIFNKYFCTKLALLPNKTDYRHLEVD